MRGLLVPSVRCALRIIDFHTHIMPPDLIACRDELCEREPWFGQLYASPSARLVAAEVLVDEMRRAGVAASVAFGFPFQDVSLCRACNDYVLDAARRNPGLILPFAVSNPRLSTGIGEARRALEAGALGLGELIPDGQGYALDDQRAMRPLMELARDANVPVLLHVNEQVGHHYVGKGWQGPREAFALITRHPENAIVLAHWGGGLIFYERMPEVRRACARVYYDTAAGPLLYEPDLYADALRWAPGRILFGSDYPLLTQRRCLAAVPEDLAGRGALLGGNADRLLGLDQAGGENHA